MLSFDWKNIFIVAKVKIRNKIKVSFMLNLFFNKKL